MRLLNDPTECVVIDLDRLPADAEDCATALQAELAPLESWIEIAEAYLVRGDERGFKTLMEMVCAPGECATRARRRRRARERESGGVGTERRRARAREEIFRETHSSSVGAREGGKGANGSRGIGDLNELERLTTMDDDGVVGARRRD